MDAVAGPAAPSGHVLQPPLPAPPRGWLRWRGLLGSSRSIALAAAALESDVPLLVLTEDPYSAARLIEEVRFYGAGAVPVAEFPAWEVLPYDVFSPYQDIVSERLATLTGLPRLQRGVLVTTVATAMHRLLPADYLQRHSLRLETGQKLELETFRRSLAESGYRFVSQVTEHGDAAVRGSILDIFPMGAEQPFRVDLFDESVDSLRTFDPETQRSLERIGQVHILPAREVALNDAGIARFRSAWRARFSGNPNSSALYRDVSGGFAPAGIEYYLPLFYDSTQSLFDYLGGDCIVFLPQDAAALAAAFWQEAGERYEQGRHDVERPLLSPEELFYRPEEFLAQCGRFRCIEAGGLALDAAGPEDVSFATRLPAAVPVDARARDPLAVFRQFQQRFTGRILVVAESAGRRETLSALFSRLDTRPEQVADWPGFLHGESGFALTVAQLDNGAQLDDPEIAVICEAQLFGDRAQQKRLRRRRQQDSDAVVRNLTELTEGAPVVHLEHGVGRYRGLSLLTIGDVPGEYICLEYAGGDKLYVPVDALELIARYTGVDPEHAPLHKLGGEEWQRARRRAAQRVYDVAVELLDIHARRAARPGHAFVIEDDAYRAFLQGFPFEETPGQQDAIDEVLRDMHSAQPMDRLVCGDAGFGKTEVAMRAAFIAVQNNRQVALLVPTTLLAQQHFQNFRDRFADWPVRIEVLSRFIGKKEQERIIADIAAGKVDIVIGTHRLLQEDLRYARLGLVVIDEEHRFGVRQKERLKALRAEIDVLTLTATPIPRTLNLALSDLRALSIISTPPLRRLSVKTFVREWNDALVREALLREISRGGQVYFLHNEVQSIQAAAERVQKLMPEARLRVAHGQMPERQLEQVMLDFYHRRFNVLVCTTIIETGIDVPSANTIIINRADKFGLAQLYQLRGRVGRSHHRAYAYLMVPPRAALSADAVKRLEAIESLEELGVGFTLATHDLEIRGAGEILGEDQSGQIQEIGYTLYMDLLEKAVRSLRSGRQPDLEMMDGRGTEINLHAPALIPESYLPDVHARLILYKRIAGTGNAEELSALSEEIIDRFGDLPLELQTLLQVTRLKQRARELGVRKVDLGPQGGRVHFHEQANVDPARVINLVKTQPATYRFDGRDKLRISAELRDVPERIALLDQLFQTIATT